MAVESTNISVVYTVTSVAEGQEFPIPFPYIEKEHVIAYYAVGDTVTNMTYGSDYTVNASTLTVTGTLPVGAKLVIHRVTPLTQEIVWVDGQAVYTPDIMQADDKLTFITQELANNVERAIKITEEDAAAGLTADDLRQSFIDLRDEAAESATAASGSADDASASAALAQAWAESDTPPDAEDPDSKSAKTWAEHGEARAMAWAESATPPDPNEPDSKSAKTWAGLAAASAGNSSDSADLAQAWAESSTPPDPEDASSKSAKSWAEEAQTIVDNGIIATGTTTARKLADRFADVINAKDFGAKGDGTTDDTAAFAALENAIQDKYVNLLGLTYKVNALPFGNYYYDGKFKVGTTITDSEYAIVKSGHRVIALGSNAGDNFVSLDESANGGYDVTLIGFEAGKSVKNSKNIVAIGRGALASEVSGGFNIAIGVDALSHCNGPETQSASVSDFQGTRNIAIGGNAGYEVTTGNRNIFIGRDCASSYTTSIGNIVLGNSAGVGSTITSPGSSKSETQTPLSGNYNVIIGMSAARWLGGSYNIVLGEQAGYNLKNTTNLIFIGRETGKGLQQNVSPMTINGYRRPMDDIEDVSATYTCTSSPNVVISTNATTISLLTVGDKVLVRFTSGSIADFTFQDDSWYGVSAINTSNNTFTVQIQNCPVTSGNVTIKAVVYSTQTISNTEATRNVFIGAYVGSQTCAPYNATVLGSHSAQKVANDCTIVGANCATNVEGVQNTVVGSTALASCTTGYNNTAIGFKTLQFLTTGNQNTAVGTNALKLKINGDNNTDFSNCVGLGAFAYTSGSNQIQLGASSTSVYAYGSVQDRSDVRDKTEIRDTELGLDFLLRLRPVDFKWDYREDYVDYVEREVERINDDGETVVEKELEPVKVQKDGSRKRHRYHHGLIAQEVKAVLDDMGIDFGGYQDHKINGGNDVLSIGYQELIAPLIKAVQQLTERVVALEAQLKELK